jgi:hypothetical protein
MTDHDYATIASFQIISDSLFVNKTHRTTLYNEGYWQRRKIYNKRT